LKQNTITHVILTGGVGSRLWPLSRKSQPKQYLEIFYGKSLYEMTVERNRNIANKIMVVGNVDNCHLSRLILDKSAMEYIDIIEATPRNTAAAIAFAAFASHPDDILMVTPSDHIIENEVIYMESVNDAILKADQGHIVTFGIKPTKPDTGFGYIEFEGDNVLAFHEKPTIDKAVEFLQKTIFIGIAECFALRQAYF
jgi:mannose-1-phosphate guanylyltransferase